MSEVLNVTGVVEDGAIVIEGVAGVQQITATGTVAAVGPVGPPGPVGATGPTGSTGATGPTGATGVGGADATTGTKGVIQLAGDLGGTAASPKIKGTITKTIATVASGFVADYYTDGTADEVEIQAAIDAVNTGGGGDVLIRAGSYTISASIEHKSGVTLRGEGRSAVTLSTSMAETSHRGIINISNRSNVVIERIGFNNSGAGAITSYGHDHLRISDCYFTGTTNSFGGIINLDGQFGSANMTRTLIERCKFDNLPNTNQAIHLYPRSGHTVEGTTIRDCIFNNHQGPSIRFDGYDVIRGTKIINNEAYDLIYGGSSSLPGAFVHSGLGIQGAIHDTLIDGNYYHNSITTVTNQSGFVWTYGTFHTVISNNIAINSWTTANDTYSVALAPGRVDSPDVGLIVTGNYFQGFRTATDTDSMVNAEFANNLIYKCGGFLELGYNVQHNVRIHDNIGYQSSHSAASAGEQFNSPTSMYKNEFSNNLLVDDRPIQPPPNLTAVATSGGSLTASTTYYYVVSALDESGETLQSSEISAATTSSNKTIVVAWSIVGGAVSYKVFRSTTSGIYTTPSLIAAQVTVSLTDSGLAVGAGAPVGSSTVAPAAMTKAIVLTGNKNFSDVVVRGNRFYLPNSTFTNSNLFSKNGSETSPINVSDNEIQDSTGVLQVGRKGVGIDPTFALHYSRTTTGTTTPFASFEENGTGDSTLQFLIPGARRFVMGIDHSDATKFKIGNAIDLATGTPLITLDPANALLGVNQASPTAFVDAPASTTSFASLRIRSGSAPTSPNSGDVWFDGTHLQGRLGSTTYQLDQQGTSFATLTKFK